MQVVHMIFALYFKSSEVIPALTALFEEKTKTICYLLTVWSVKPCNNILYRISQIYAWIIYVLWTESTIASKACNWYADWLFHEIRHHSFSHKLMNATKSLFLPQSYCMILEDLDFMILYIECGWTNTLTII